jgi:hypothetical protein
VPKGLSFVDEDRPHRLLFVAKFTSKANFAEFYIYVEVIITVAWKSIQKMPPMKSSILGG